jgi:NodT family efflux transporter outer membrane factor (OMF) lipoprotein
MRKPIALLSALLLSACVSAPPTEPQLKAVDAAAAGLGTAPAPHYPVEWWKAFQDPQIDRLAAQVISGNPTLQSALVRIRAAQAQVSLESANDLPMVDLEGQEQRELLSKNFIIPPPYGGSWRWMGTLQSTLSWNIDFWGKQADLIAKARDTEEAARLDAEAAKLALSGAFAQTYIDLMLAYQNGDIADRTVAERQDILRLTQDRTDAGLENAQALEQAKALLSLAKIDQLRFQVQRELDVHALAALTGQGAGLYASVTRPALTLNAAVPLPDQLPGDLLSRRPDVLAAMARVDAAAKGRSAAHADFYPSVNLGAFFGWQAIGLSNMLGVDALTMGAGPAIRMPIFDAGRIRAQYAGATAQLDGAVADYNGAVTNAVKQVADALTEVKSLKAQRAEQDNALASAEKSFSYAEDRYKAGLSTQIVLLNAESTLLQVRQQSASLAARDISQRITLMLSVGGGFTPPPPPSDPKIEFASKDLLP